MREITVKRELPCEYIKVTLESEGRRVFEKKFREATPRADILTKRERTPRQNKSLSEPKFKSERLIVETIQTLQAPHNLMEKDFPTFPFTICSVQATRRYNF